MPTSRRGWLGAVAIALPEQIPYMLRFMANLTKRDLVISISEKTGLIQQDVFSVIQLTLDGITEALASGKDVELREFGVFRTTLTKQRVGRNPKKPDQDVVIPPRAIVKFKAGKIMRERVLKRTAELSK
jgi:nucleoid DNA-binding protein